jgi:hypothetical protein
MKARRTMPMIKETVIELADCGQNFKQFYVDGNNFVTDARRFANRLSPESHIWKGYRILNKVIRKGTVLRLVKDGKERVIKYPVFKITRHHTIAS